MTPDAFERLVDEAEELAARNPRGYHLRVAALGALGYLYVWALLLAALALAALVVLGAIGSGSIRLPGYVIPKLLIPLLAFVGIVLKALWVRLGAPAGLRMTRRDFPELFETLARIRAAVRGPRIHEVLLNEQLNAFIAQVPRLGVFGWHRNYLVIGLPLLLGLSREEVEAVLTHEYGHLSGAHGKLGSWIYRIRATWIRLMQALHERRAWGSGVVTRFFDWYAPYFQAYSFALARANEYAADRAAASFVGAEHLGAALMRLSILDPYLDGEYWPGIQARAAESPVPPEGPFTELARFGFTAAAVRAGERLEAALRVPTGRGDTHPSLADRLEALGIAPRPPGAIEESAATTLLGSRLPELLQRVDSIWRESVASWFEERHGHVLQAQARLAALDAREAAPSVDELMERASILDDLQGREAALPVYRQVLRVDPEHALARCMVGFAAVRSGDESGEEMMEAAMRHDPSLLLDGLQALGNHYAQAGDTEKARRFHDRFVERYEELQRIEAERHRIPFQPIYDPPDLPEESMAAIRNVLEEHGGIRRAYLARKRVTLSTAPCYVLGLVPRFRFTLTDTKRKLSRSVVDSLDVPEEVFVVVVTGSNERLMDILREVEGSRLL